MYHEKKKKKKNYVIVMKLYIVLIKLYYARLSCLSIRVRYYDVVTARAFVPLRACVPKQRFYIHKAYLRLTTFPAFTSAVSA